VRAAGYAGGGTYQGSAGYSGGARGSSSAYQRTSSTRY
jgi:hypothetical protein